MNDLQANSIPLAPHHSWLRRSLRCHLYRTSPVSCRAAGARHTDWQPGGAVKWPSVAALAPLKVNQHVHMPSARIGVMCKLS